MVTSNRIYVIKLIKYDSHKEISLAEFLLSRPSSGVVDVPDVTRRARRRGRGGVIRTGNGIYCLRLQPQKFTIT
jgi:hypothetical protein